MSKNISCLQKLPVHDGFSYECLSPGTVSASHTTVLLLLSQATSETMEMSDVVFTVPRTVLRCEECRAAGCRYPSEYNALAHLELPPNAAGHVTGRKCAWIICNPHIQSLDTQGWATALITEVWLPRCLSVLKRSVGWDVWASVEKV